MENNEYVLKKLDGDSIPEAVEKAHRYRLLNEPLEAESICLDILEVAPDNQEAVVILILALTDQFSKGLQPVFRDAVKLLEKLPDEYNQLYYEGVICERRAKASHQLRRPSSGHVAYEWLQRALNFYERASALSPAGNADADLRWNTVVRIMERFPDIRPDPAEWTPTFLE